MKDMVRKLIACVIISGSFISVAFGQVQNGGSESTTSQKVARGIMGKNFFGVEEATKYFRVIPSQWQLEVLSEIPFSEEVLKQSKETHVLIAIFPLSIVEIREGLKFLFYEGVLEDRSWYDKKLFAKKPGKFGWQLVRKTAIPKSTSKDWQEQQALLGEDNEIPNAQAVVYAVVAYYLATGEWLFDFKSVRTSSVPEKGYHVTVDSSEAVVRVGLYRDDRRSSRLGIASAQRLPRNR